MKPSNILRTRRNAYLADFGIAKDVAASDRTGPHAVKGSLLYLAPEQIRGEAITPRTDVYALGVVLYEVLVGEHPFATSPTWPSTSASCAIPFRRLAACGRTFHPASTT